MKMAHGLKFSPRTLSKYKHGVAYVSNVDGRGIFSVYGIFKRGQKPSYDLVNILCYVAGEIRDGFLVERLTENELVPILESTFRLAVGKAVFQPVAIEEAAKLLVIPCYEKAKARGIELFSNCEDEVQRSFEFYERVSRFCPYSSEEEFVMAKGGSEVKKTFSHLDLRRREFDAWWLEKSELEHLGCPLPVPPVNYPESGQLLSGGGMIDFMSEVNNQRSKISAWKKTTLEKFSIPVNFERLVGISRHQALWYTWKGDLKMGVTMLESAKKIRDDQSSERTMNARIPVVELFLNLTQIKLARMGECEGQFNKVDWQVSKGPQCKICHAPAKKKTSDASPGTWILTCVEKDGRGKIGTDVTRKTLVTALAIVKQIKDLSKFQTAVQYSLKDSLEIFLEHSFVNLYWKKKPTTPMTEALVDEAVILFVKAIDSENFDPYGWGESCRIILQELMSKHCNEKLSEGTISDVGQLFKRAFESQIIQNIYKIQEVPQYASLHDDTTSLHQLNSVMTAMSVAPSIANQFLFKWQGKTDKEKKKALSGSFNDLLAATKKVYRSYLRNDLPPCLSQNSDSSQSVCNKKECACQDLAKFQDYVVDLLSSGRNPVSFLSCSSEGNVTLTAALFMDNSGELISDMILCHDMYIYEEIMDVDNHEEFAKCPHLAQLCKFACGEIYTMLKVRMVADFKETIWRKNASLEMRHCFCCGQMASEDVNLLKCGACKAVVYCTLECQKKDWKAGHKQKCHTLRKP